MTTWRAAIYALQIVATLVRCCINGEYVALCAYLLEVFLFQECRYLIGDVDIIQI